MHPLSFALDTQLIKSRIHTAPPDGHSSSEICALCMFTRLLQSITSDTWPALRFSCDGFEPQGRGGCWRSQEPEGKFWELPGRGSSREGQVNGRQQGFWPSGKNLSSVTVKLGFHGWRLSNIVTLMTRVQACSSGLSQASFYYLPLVARYLFLLPLSFHLGVKTFMSSFHLKSCRDWLVKTPTPRHSKWICKNS